MIASVDNCAADRNVGDELYKTTVSWRGDINTPELKKKSRYMCELVCYCSFPRPEVWLAVDGHAKPLHTHRFCIGLNGLQSDGSYRFGVRPTSGTLFVEILYCSQRRWVGLCEVSRKFGIRHQATTCAL
jgi:hypothetical protein